MKIRQYSYFALYSGTMPAAEMAGRLQMDPDEVMVLGSKSARHRIPRSHSWRIARRSSESIDEQIEHLIDRVKPILPQVISLVAHPEVSASMNVVRYYHDPDGVHEAPGGTPSSECHRWPHPLGWHLSSPVLEFLLETGAELDIDEYDWSDSETTAATT
ncbi:DUF4279 domain-containing protein [Nocardia sp. NPDC058658]|uniref:DUF4279 domain-containing protein n=1 Tax=Nocardia sp. NPDC058658 TaxID=3346580 RepID=UPI0036619CD6